MRNSEKYKYSKGKGKNAGSSSKPMGKAKPYLAFKFSPEIENNLNRSLINMKTSKGVIGKVSPQFAAISQY